MKTPRLVKCIVVIFLLAQANSVFGQVVVSNDGEIISFGANDRAVSDSKFAGLLIDPEVLAEIELVGKQKNKIENLLLEQGKQNKQALDMMRFELAGAKTEATKQAILKKYEAQSQSRDIASEATIKKVLLPHQIKTLEMIAIQQKVESEGLDRLVSSKFGSNLGLSQQQQAELAEKAKEIRQKLDADIKKLKQKALEEFLSQVPPQQRQILKAKFEFDSLEVRPAKRLKIEIVK